MAINLNNPNNPNNLAINQNYMYIVDFVNNHFNLINGDNIMNAIRAELNWLILMRETDPVILVIDVQNRYNQLQNWRNANLNNDDRNQVNNVVNVLHALNLQQLKDIRNWF